MHHLPAIACRRTIVWRFIASICWSLLCASHAIGAEKGEPIAIVVNTNNPTQNLTTDQLRHYCMAEQRHWWIWPNGRKVTVAIRETGSAEREVVLREVFEMTETQFTRHCLQLTFCGTAQCTPKQLETGHGLRRFVVNVPGAIGFMRLSEVDASVKIISLDGLLPTNSGYRLYLPAPATGPVPPERASP